MTWNFFISNSKKFIRGLRKCSRKKLSFSYNKSYGDFLIQVLLDETSSLMANLIVNHALGRIIQTVQVDTNII